MPHAHVLLYVPLNASHATADAEYTLFSHPEGEIGQKKEAGD
jgi:hypothetical protein